MADDHNMDARPEIVTQMPLERIFHEGKSQRDRRVKEIMDILFSHLPDKPGNLKPDFILGDGTQCRIVKFAAPRRRDGEFWYGFDVELNSGPLRHLEFEVRCSGWERTI